MTGAPPEADPAAAHALIAESGAILIDVREDDEWAAGHAPDAVHVRLGDLDPAAYPPEQKLVVVCRSGARSSTAVAALTDAGRAEARAIGAEIREALEPETLSRDMAEAWAHSEALSTAHPARRMAGAVSISCTGRGGPHFGGPSAEMQIIRHALGDVPLVGFFAAGEIAHNRLYGYTGVLTVFTTE